MTYRERQIRSIQQKQTQQYEKQLSELREQLERKRGKKQTYKGELGKVEKDLQIILNKWKFGEKSFKTAEEFLNEFTPWIEKQLESKSSWKEFLTKYEAKDLEELGNKLDQSQQNHLNYLETLQEKQELEFRYNELEIERKNWLNPYLSKIESLETQLFNLAKQKLTSQKEGQQLLKHLNEKHEQDREWWSSELAKSKEVNSELKKDYKNQLIKQAEEQKQEQLKTIKELQTNLNNAWNDNKKIKEDKEQLIQQFQEKEENFKTSRKHNKKQKEELEKKVKNLEKSIENLVNEEIKNNKELKEETIRELLNKELEKERNSLEKREKELIEWKDKQQTKLTKVGERAKEAEKKLREAEKTIAGHQDTKILKRIFELYEEKPASLYDLHEMLRDKKKGWWGVKLKGEKNNHD